MRRIRKFSALVAGAALVVAGVFVSTSSAEASAVGTAEGETFTGSGAVMRSDATASGGKYLFEDSAVTVSTSVTLTAPSDRLTVTLRGNGNLTYKVFVDGVQVAQPTEKSTTWVARDHAGTWSTGAHKVGVRPVNVSTQNLYLDKVAFQAAASSTPPPPTTTVPTTTVPTTTVPPPTTTVPSTTPPASGEVVMPNAFVTAYTYYDNTPPGSADISHPVLHQKAGGVGTYADPVTIAVGHDLHTGSDVLDYPQGTRFYIPDVRRYFIVEDTCGDGPTPELRPCHNLTASGNPAPAGSTTWVDIWINGGDGTNEAADACAYAVSDTHTVVVNPASNYAVAGGVVGVMHDTTCDHGYGEALVTTP